MIKNRNDLLDWWQISIFVALVVLGGVLIGSCDRTYKYQNEAVERGYAEWAMPDNGRGRTIWRWIEPEGE